MVIILKESSIVSENFHFQNFHVQKGSRSINLFDRALSSISTSFSKVSELGVYLLLSFRGGRFTVDKEDHMLLSFWKENVALSEKKSLKKSLKWLN